MKTMTAWIAASVMLVASAAQAGTLAPGPNVIATFGRDVIERSGALTLEEMLNAGVTRSFFEAGQYLLVLVNGRPYATTSEDLESIPLSAVERIEVFGADGLGALGFGTVRGAFNVILRKDVDGFDTSAAARAPTRDGGDARQGGVFWTGALGKGRMTIGADIVNRREIPGDRREHSRSEWLEGGTFAQTKNVSAGGNTLIIRQIDQNGESGDWRSVALGDCDPAKSYIPGLRNPGPVSSGDEGCGFAYGDVWWADTDRDELQTAILSLDHPLGDGAALHLDANIGRSVSKTRYAPSIGGFNLTPDQDLLQRINEAAGSAFQADENDSFTAYHRFLGHGNRDWVTDSDRYNVTLAFDGLLTETLGYDVRLNAYRTDSFRSGVNLVIEDRIRERIESGDYDLENALSREQRHLEAIEYSRAREQRDTGSGGQSIRLALEGTGFSFDDRNATWAAGIRMAGIESHETLRYLTNDGEVHGVTDVLGSGGRDFTGERETAAAFAEMFLPVADNVDVRVEGRGVASDDVGGLGSWRLGAEYRPHDFLSLRTSWGEVESPPSMFHLHVSAAEDFPFVNCDPGAGPPPRTCDEGSASLQVAQQLKGNPQLDPEKAQRFAAGAELRYGPLFIDTEWYRYSTSDGAGQNTATWAILNLPECRDGSTNRCIERDGAAVTIHQGYSNVVEFDTSGINTNFGGGMRTGWGVIGLSGTWRHVLNTDNRVAGVETPYPVSRNSVRLELVAIRGNLSAGWTVGHRSEYKNEDNTGIFKSWTGHDVSVRWADPFGLTGARMVAGVINLTDTPAATDSADPSLTQGPPSSLWGRTFFFNFNMRF